MFAKNNFYLFIGLILAVTIHTAHGLTEIDEKFYPNFFITQTVSYADLANGNPFVLYTAISSQSQYRITQIVTCTQDAVDFAGGDRDISVGTINQEKWVIPAASLAVSGTSSLTTNNVGVGIQPTASSPALSLTDAGQNIVVRYSGGTTDYTSGAVTISIAIFQSNQ